MLLRPSVTAFEEQRNDLGTALIHCDRRGHLGYPQRDRLRSAAREQAALPPGFQDQRRPAPQATGISLGAA
jgi:hypothetical protein